MPPVSAADPFCPCSFQRDLLPLISILREAAGVPWRARGLERARQSLKKNTFEEYIMTQEHPHIMLSETRSYNTLDDSFM